MVGQSPTGISGEDPVTSLSLTQVADVLSNSEGLLDEHTLGSLTTIPWIETSYLTSREGISNSITISLEVLVKPEHLPKGWTWKKDCQWSQRHIISGDKFGSMATNPDAEIFLISVFVDLARRFAPTFFEIDPRMGFTMLDAITNGFPSSPLFDPSPPMRTPLLYVEVYQEITDWTEDNMFLRSKYPELKRGMECVFCNKSVVVHDTPEEILWGGGNISWVHKECAHWINRWTQQINP
jgi:hypothetical protein